MERLFTKNLSQISYDDILNFISTGASESVHLDYKREIDETDKARKELAKDVSAFANSQGGHIIIGVDEKELKPVLPVFGTLRKINGVEISEWIAQVLNATVAQRVAVEVHTIFHPDQENKCIVVIRIPRSHRAPHMVTFQGDNRYYRRYFKRHQYESLPAEEYEVREMFERSSRMRDYVDDYLAVQGYADPRRRQFGRNYWTDRLANQGTDGFERAEHWVSIVACPSYLEEYIDVTSPEFKNWIEGNERRYQPFLGGGSRVVPKSRVIILDGVVYMQDESKALWGRFLRLHRNGFFEFAAPAFHWETPKGDVALEWVYVTTFFWLVLGLVCDFYKHIDISSSIRLMLNVANTRDVILAGLGEGYVTMDNDHRGFFNKHRCHEANVSYVEDVNIKLLTTSLEVEEVVRRYATRLGNAFGYDEPLCYNKEDGQIPIGKLSPYSLLGN